jgi:hypothetical protein
MENEILNENMEEVKSLARMLILVGSLKMFIERQFTIN